jgi:hypothetical protein
MVVATLLASCSSETNNLSAPLRQAAEGAYEHFTARCESQLLTERRRDAVKSLASEFTKLEKETLRTLAGIDFMLAKQMNDYKLDNGNTFNCGFPSIPDEQLDFAHEKRWFKGAIAESKQLARSRMRTSELPAWVDVKNAGKFRTIAGDIYSLLDPLCPVSDTQAWSSFEANTQSAMRSLRGKLASSPYLQHLEIAEADANYVRSITVAECAKPTNGEALRSELEKWGRETHEAIGELTRLAS